MKRSHVLLPVIVFLWLANACNIDLATVDYGNDVCHYCKMTIVDATHSAVWVSEKGKVHKFDAIECLVHFEKESDIGYSRIVVADFLNPGKMIPAEESYFLISRNIPSPMGAYLSALSEETSAVGLQESNGGLIFSWSDLIKTVEQTGWPEAD